MTLLCHVPEYPLLPRLRYPAHRWPPLLQIAGHFRGSGVDGTCDANKRTRHLYAGGRSLYIQCSFLCKKRGWHEGKLVGVQREGG